MAHEACSMHAIRQAALYAGSYGEMEKDGCSAQKV
jgi:hypothetical protein